MQAVAIQFLTDVLKPWDELNQSLSQPFAYRPDFSDVTRIANSLAVALKHTAELTDQSRSAIDQASFGNRIMSDRADAWKHGEKSLREPARRNSMTVLSRFEFNEEGEFRFLRNRLVIDHATHGTLDFMEQARDAASFWLQRLGLQVQWNSKILVGPRVFKEAALIYYDASQQIGMPSFQLETVKRNSQGRVEAADCPRVVFRVMDHTEDAFKQLGPPISSDE
jgi:hypothetical protein